MSVTAEAATDRPARMAASSPSSVPSSTSNSHPTTSPRSTGRSSSSPRSRARAPRSSPRWPSTSATSRVRAIAMKPTDGLRRGQPVRNLGRGISVPVGRATLGHVFNVIGEPLDTHGEPVEGARRPLGHPPPLPAVRRARASAQDVRDRPEGRRPARALRAGRQDRPLRRGRASARPSSSSR